MDREEEILVILRDIKELLIGNMSHKLHHLQWILSAILACLLSILAGVIVLLIRGGLPNG